MAKKPTTTKSIRKRKEKNIKPKQIVDGVYSKEKMQRSSASVIKGSKYAPVHIEGRNVFDIFHF